MSYKVNVNGQKVTTGCDPTPNKPPKVRRRLTKIKCLRVPAGGITLVFPDEEVAVNLKFIVRIVTTKEVRVHLRQKKNDKQEILPGTLANRKNAHLIVGFSSAKGGTVYLYFESVSTIGS